MLKRVISPVVFLLLISLWPTRAAAGTPDWLRILAQQPQKHYADDVDAVTLLDDEATIVRDNGEIVHHLRVAYRILRPEGRKYARLAIGFSGETKLNSLHGWSITAKGQEYEVKDKDAFERSASTYEIFSDIRYRILEVPGAEVGTVVGYEYEQKRRPYLFHDSWDFQDTIPVEHSRFTLQLPSSWEFKSGWENHAPVEPVSQNGSYTWELTDIPRIEEEYNKPPERALAGHMQVNFFSEKIKNQSYGSWNELGMWYSTLVAPSVQTTPQIQEAVQKIAPASMPMLDRIRALARFAQHDIRYAAIEIGIGGYLPHPAGDIFSHKYGDCKDKATLLRTMLAQIGVKAYHMPINTERGTFTSKSTPTSGFDHVIIAIQLPDASYSKPMPAVYEHPRLGHLLIFDPTNELVPFGQLPFYEQDSYALLVTDNGGELIHLPVSTPELNSIKRSAKLKLLPDGTLQGEIEEVRTGYRAALGRELMHDESEKDRKKTIEYFLGRNMGSFQIDGFDVVNADDIDKDLIVHYKFKADHYAKNAGPLLLVRPRVVGEKAGAFDSTKPRHYPYELEAPFLDSDSVEITLPEGFIVDELPEPAKAAFSFGEYKSKTEAQGSLLKYTREYKIQATQVPLDSIDQLRKLFLQINADEKNMAVLKKGN